MLYEYPCNERIRTLLRLEDLFDRLFFFMHQTDPREHHIALVTLFDILEVAARADLKSDLLQELERQRASLLALREHPQVQTDVVDQVLADIEMTQASFGQMVGKAGQHLRDNEWLMTIRSRSLIPGGACEFDLPGYHAWQHRSPQDRLLDLQEWAAPFLPLRDAMAIVLRLLRESSSRQRVVATQGCFQQNIVGNRPVQLLRVRLETEEAIFPEVSANKYMLSLRFFRYEGAQKSQGPVALDIPFDLVLCQFNL